MIPSNEDLEAQVDRCIMKHFEKNKDRGVTVKRIKTNGRPKSTLKGPIVMSDNLRNQLYPVKQRPMVTWMMKIMIEAQESGIVKVYRFLP
jgi:hypothetical protein